MQWASGNTQDISKSIGLLGPGIVAALDTNGNNIAFSGGLAGSGGLTKFGAGNLTLNAFAFYSGITTINAGSIILGNQNGLGSGPVVVNVSNGVSFASGLANAYFGSLGGPGSLVLTTAGNTAIALAVGQDNVLTTYSGQLSGKGSLTKSGSGALLLAASNAYSGTTAINQGELLVDGSLASAVTVNSGGTLGGMGHLSSVTVESGGLLAPGGATPQMSLGGTLTLLSSAVMDYQTRYALGQRHGLHAVGPACPQRPAIRRLLLYPAWRLRRRRLHAYRRRFDYGQSRNEHQRHDRWIASLHCHPRR